MATEKKPKSRAHKESKKTGARGARPVKLTELQKYLMSGKSTRRMKTAGRLAQIHTEDRAKKELAEKNKKKTGHDAFKKLAEAS